MMGQLNSIFPYDGFALGFNGSSGFFGPSAEDIAGYLENKGLTFETSSAQIAGVINPYISVVGRSAGSWSTASAFRDALLSAIAEFGFAIDYSAPINYQIMPRPRSGSAQPAPAPVPRPSTPRPRPVESTPSEEEGVWVAAVEPLPSSFYETPSQQQQQQQLPPPQQKGISTTWLLLGLGLIAVIAISRD